MISNLNNVHARSVGRRHRLLGLLGTAILVFGAGALAFDSGLLKVFKAGDVIKADEVNANFKALADAISAAEALVPPGTILAFGGTSAPAGYLLCDGAALDKAKYPSLFLAIGTSFGDGTKKPDGSASTGTNFNVPDFRGRFLRGRDGGSKRDPDAAKRTASQAGGASADAVGSWQDGEVQLHNHLYGQEAKGALGSGGSRFPTITDGGPTDASGKLAGGNETRPVNVYVNYIIKI